jgi:integrase
MRHGTGKMSNTRIHWARILLGGLLAEVALILAIVPLGLRFGDNFLPDYKTAWRKAARDAGIPDRRIYDLRASFASRANACRASGLTIAQLLGHENNTQILPTYVKALDENTKAVIEALDAARAARSNKPPAVQ